MQLWATAIWFEKRPLIITGLNISGFQQQYQFITSENHQSSTGSWFLVQSGRCHTSTDCAFSTYLKIRSQMDQLKMMDFWMKYKPLPHFFKNCTWIGWIEFDLIFPAILFLTFQLKKNLNLFLSRWQTFSFNNESWEAKKNVTEAFMSLLFCFTTLSLLYLRDCAKHLTVVKKVPLALQVIFSSSKGLSLVVWDFELCKKRIGRTWAKSSGWEWH